MMFTAGIRGKAATDKPDLDQSFCDLPSQTTITQSGTHAGLPQIGEEPPRFVVPLRNQTANDGGRAVFRVGFRGIPVPTLTWHFNNQLIRPNQDFKVSMDARKGEGTLVIVEIFPDDEGEYTCQAENHLGVAITHCHLFVRCKSSS